MELNEIEFVVLRAIYNETKDVNSKGTKGNQIFPNMSLIQTSFLKSYQSLKN